MIPFLCYLRNTQQKRNLFLTQIIVICNQYEIKEIIKKKYMYIQLGAILFFFLKSAILVMKIWHVTSIFLRELFKIRRTILLLAKRRDYWNSPVPISSFTDQFFSNKIPFKRIKVPNSFIFNWINLIYKDETTISSLIPKERK